MKFNSFSQSPLIAIFAFVISFNFSLSSFAQSSTIPSPDEKAKVISALKLQLPDAYLTMNIENSKQPSTVRVRYVHFFIEPYSKRLEGIEPGQYQARSFQPEIDLLPVVDESTNQETDQLAYRMKLILTHFSSGTKAYQQTLFVEDVKSLIESGQGKGLIVSEEGTIFGGAGKIIETAKANLKIQIRSPLERIFLNNSFRSTYQVKDGSRVWNSKLDTRLSVISFPQSIAEKKPYIGQIEQSAWDFTQGNLGQISQLPNKLIMTFTGLITEKSYNKSEHLQVTVLTLENCNLLTPEKMTSEKQCQTGTLVVTDNFLDGSQKVTSYPILETTLPFQPKN